jgi:hypothetical protein
MFDLSSDGAGKQGLSGSGGADEKAALGQFAAEGAELFLPRSK